MLIHGELQGEIVGQCCVQEGGAEGERRYSETRQHLSKHSEVLLLWNETRTK